jgi:protein TonB
MNPAWGAALGLVMQAPLVELRHADIGEPTVDRAPAVTLDLGNVVPFVRPNARSPEHDNSAQIIDAPERTFPAARDEQSRTLLIALLVAFAVHVTLLVLLSRPAPPLPGIELAPMTVEIIVSDGAVPSVNPSAGERTPAQLPNDQQTPKQEPEASPTEPQSADPAAQQQAEKTPPAPEPEQAQRQALAPPEQPQQIEPLPTQPEVVTPPAPPQQPEARPTEPKAIPAPASKQQQFQPAAPRSRQTPAREAKPRQEAAPTGRANDNARKAASGAKPSAAAPARQSRSDPNYSGTVFAHLARFKRMPADAQRNRSQGTARVRFVIDGRGNVGSVQLVGSSGFVSLDQEALAWPRRASPFPPPPGGQPMPITAPVTFHF